MNGNYERIILEAMSRISALEERVTVLERAERSEKKEQKIDLSTSSKKFRALSDFLFESGENEVSLRISDFQDKLGIELPESALEHRAYWANTLSHSISKAWLGVGYKVVDLNIDKKTPYDERCVVFEKIREYEKI